jgi:hypothetical protein
MFQLKISNKLGITLVVMYTFDLGVKGELSEPQTAIEREEVRIDRRC